MPAFAIDKDEDLLNIKLRRFIQIMRDITAVFFPLLNTFGQQIFNLSVD